MPNKNDFIAGDLNEYISTLNMYYKGSANVSILPLKVLFSMEEAKKSIQSYLKSEVKQSKILSPKQKKFLSNATAPIKITSDYFSVIGSIHHVSKVEFEYKYSYNGNSINMSPRIYDANIEIDVCIRSFDGDYFVGGLAPNEYRKDYTRYEDVPTDDVAEKIESDFQIHQLKEVERNYVNERTKNEFLSRLSERLQEEKQQSLGKGRPITNVHIYDYEETVKYTSFLVPFYLFQYDTGKEIITVAFNAYTGRIAQLTIGNPVLSLKYALPIDISYPRFSIVICIIASLACIVFGGIIYSLWYLSSVNSFKKKLQRMSYQEQKLLL